jgi:hypothetical protein
MLIDNKLMRIDPRAVHFNGQPSHINHWQRHIFSAEDYTNDVVLDQSTVTFQKGWGL